MKVEAQLTEDEQDLLLLMLGYATGMVIYQLHPALAPVCVRIINKLMALNPEFAPYDETSFDFLKFQESAFPFKMQRPQ